MNAALGALYVTFAVFVLFGSLMGALTFSDYLASKGKAFLSVSVLICYLTFVITFFVMVRQ